MFKINKGISIMIGFRTMCLLTLEPIANTDGKIQQKNRSISCQDGSNNLQIHQFSSIDENKEYEKKAKVSFIKTPSSIRKKLEAAINLDRSLNEDAVEDEDMSKVRVVLTPVDGNLETQRLQNGTKNLKEEHLKLEKEKDPFFYGVRRFQRNPFLEHGRRFQTQMSFSSCEFLFIDPFRRSQTRLLNAIISNKRIQEIVRRQCETMTDEQKRFERNILEEIREHEKELKEYISQMFLMMLLFLLIKNISGNITCRQTSSRKYPCLNSILFLLWQSGDVEANPGPPNSITYRNWLYDVCSVVRKVGVSTDCKMKKIWQQPPENWRSEEPYFDPRNSNRSVNDVETFLYMIIECCDDLSKLSDEILSEICTWNEHRSKDNVQLLNMYTSRECYRSAEKNGKLIRSNLEVDEVLTLEVKTGIQVSLSRQSATDQQFPTHKMYRAEATRKIASFLGRILHGKDPEKKCNHIWRTKPDCWPPNLRYYSPNNGGERCDDNEDGMVVEALIALCGKKLIKFEKTYQDMVDAWQAADQTLLSKLLIRHTAETDLKKAVVKLHEEGLLQDPDVDKHLRELGFFVQCDRSTQNAKSQKRKMVNTMNKHETKRTKQSDHEDAVDTALKELLPDCSIGQLLDNQSDSSLLDMISQKIPDFLGDEVDDVQFHWT